MVQSILLCCRKESSEYCPITGELRGGTCRHIKNYGFEDSWIHDDRDVASYRELQKQTGELLENGMIQFDRQDID